MPLQPEVPQPCPLIDDRLPANRRDFTAIAFDDYKIFVAVKHRSGKQLLDTSPVRHDPDNDRKTYDASRRGREVSRSPSSFARRWADRKPAIHEVV